MVVEPLVPQTSPAPQTPDLVCEGAIHPADPRPRAAFRPAFRAVWDCLSPQTPHVGYCLPTDSRAEEGGECLLTDPRLGVVAAETMPQTLGSGVLSSYRQILEAFPKDLSPEE